MHRDRLLVGGALPLNGATGPMKIVTIIARILLGLMFFVFGLNPFLKFLPMLQLEGV